MLTVFGFDFGPLRGDVLGELYQQYFDPETRLALGEFYTPPEVVEFILDEFGYDGFATGRLLDPACGSGTFLVGALHRYLSAHVGEPPETILSRLVGELHIVGFDVNPFAVHLAQVNYAAQLLPTYAEALKSPRKSSTFVIQNLPVYRTDSLRFEKREAVEEQIAAPEGTRRSRRGRAPLPGAIGFRLTYAGDMAVVRDRLPVRGPGGDYIEVSLPVPRPDIALERHLIDNPEEYTLALSALFDAVDAEDNAPQLMERLANSGFGSPRELAEFMAPALEGIRETVQHLRDEYEDGRFQKSLRDLAVAMVVKNELRFDFVVGNPPYVRVQRIPQELRSYWVDQYEWTQGNFDIYMPFIERSLTGWLSESGQLAFICSNRFLVANYAEEFRKELLNVASPDLILDLRDTRVFSGALNYPAIFVFRKSAARSDSILSGRAFTDPEAGPSALLGDARTVLRSVSAVDDHKVGDFVDAFRVPIGNLGRQGWHLMPPAERCVFERLLQAGTQRLEELIATDSGGFQGLATGADEVMILRLVEDKGGMLRLRPRDGGPDAEIEKEAVRRWLFGRDVERWYVDWDGWYVLFPYVRVDGKFQLAPSHPHAEHFPYNGRIGFVEDWPGFWEYVNRRTVKTKLQARENGRWRAPNQRHLWYGAARPQNLEHYEQQKVVLQISSTAPDFAVDSAGHVFQAGGRGGGVYGLLPSNTDAQHLAYLTALLNSRPLDFVLKHVSTVYMGKAYSYSDAFLKQLPIVLPSGKREEDIAARIRVLSQLLSQVKTNLRKRQREVAGFPDSYIASLPGGVHRYGLDRLADGNPLSRQLAQQEVYWQVQLDGRPVMSFGRSRLVLPSEAHAEVMRQWLALQPRQAISTRDLMALRLPQAEQGCLLLLGLLADHKGEISRLQRQIAEAESEINELVLTLYGLNQDREARAVIDDFLARF